MLEAPSAELAVEIVRDRPVDLLLVDLMLPGMSGFDLVRAIRQGSDVPIVIVTARGDSNDVVAGIDAGADDYVRKPFVVKELEARLRALLRRTDAQAHQPSSAEPIRFGDFELVPEAGALTRDGEPVALTRTEFRLLLELVEHEGMVLSREQLLERVWGYDYFGDARLVDAHIRRLRTKIERDPSEPDFVVTVRGFGYKFAP